MCHTCSRPVRSCLQVLDQDTVRSMAEDYGVETLDKEAAGVALLAKKSQRSMDGGDEDDTNMLPRPPVVTVMGHVDHGKVHSLCCML